METLARQCPGTGSRVQRRSPKVLPSGCGNKKQVGTFMSASKQSSPSPRLAAPCTHGKKCIRVAERLLRAVQRLPLQQVPSGIRGVHPGVLGDYCRPGRCSSVQPSGWLHVKARVRLITNELYSSTYSCLPPCHRQVMISLNNASFSRRTST